MSMLKALKTAKQQEAAAADAEKKDGEEPAAKVEFGSLVKSLNLQRLKGQADKPNIANRRRYSNPENVKKIEQLPFEPSQHPEWSPRGVAQDAIDYIEDQNQDERSLSPVRKMCRDNLNKNANHLTKALVHHVEIDADKIKKAANETTLHNVTSVKTRTQRALSAEEVATNCEKSIEFFRKNRELNEKDTSIKAETGAGWSKLRKKFLKT